MATSGNCVDVVACNTKQSRLQAAQISNSCYTPCPKFRCNWKCRIGYQCKCGSTACRVELHSVSDEF